jgi:hypothetical protein
MDASKALGQLPATLRDELLQAFSNIITNFREGRWEPSELNGGKLCEIIYSILIGYISGTFPAKSSKPSNMLAACQALERSASTSPRSIRIQIPRILIGLYEIRNNRGVGHTGGDVNPNHMDATVIVYCSKWLLAELVRIFHNVDTATANEVVENMIEKEIPTVWCINNKKRVLNNNLTMKEKTLLLLYSENSPTNEIDLISWVEHTNSAVYRRDILIRGHKARLWEYDRKLKTITLSPVGIKYVEEKLHDHLN